MTSLPRRLVLGLIGAYQAANALVAAEALNATVANMRFVKPLDTELIKTLADQHELLVTVEENAVMGGAGSAVNEWLMAQGIDRPVLNLGLPDVYVEHAKPAEMLAECGLDVTGIERSIRERLSLPAVINHA